MITVGQFAEIIELGRSRYDGNINSWGRDEGHNHTVEGHDDSFHLVGLAVDMWFADSKNAKRCADFYRRQGLYVKWMIFGRSMHVQALDPSTRDPDL
jgi:hypothetical protein